MGTFQISTGFNYALDAKLAHADSTCLRYLRTPLLIRKIFIGQYAKKAKNITLLHKLCASLGQAEPAARRFVIKAAQSVHQLG